jgi:hypothetical protein
MSANTTDDLRRVLGEHTSFASPVPTADRLAAVRGRVSVARRRRQAGVAIAALVAASTTAVLLAQPQRLDPAALRDLAGHAAPETFSSLGYVYRFERAVHGTGTASLELPSSDRAVLVSWATSAGSGTITVPDDLDGNGTSPDTIPVGPADFSTFEYVAPGLSGPVAIRASGEVAVAVYTLRDAAPVGSVAQDGVAYRADLDGDSLLGAAIGAAAQSELDVTIENPTRPLVVHDFCYGAGAGLQVNVAINDDDPLSFGACGDSPPFDGAGSSYTLSAGIPNRMDPFRPGDLLDVRVWVTRDDGHDVHPSFQAASAPGVHLGLGLYEEAPAVETVAGWPIHQTTECDGHRWDFVRVARSTGTSSVTIDIVAGDTPLLVESLSRGATGKLSLQLDGKQANAGVAADGAHRASEAVLRDRRAVAELVMDGTAEPSTQLAIAIYRRLD